MIGVLLRSETYVTILKYIDLWGETLPETLFRPWESTGGAASASSREGAASDHVVTGCGGPLVPVDVREVHGEICVSFVTIQFLFQKANKQQRYD